MGDGFALRFLSLLKRVNPDVCSTSCPEQTDRHLNTEQGEIIGLGEHTIFRVNFTVKFVLLKVSLLSLYSGGFPWFVWGLDAYFREKPEIE